MSSTGREIFNIKQLPMEIHNTPTMGLFLADISDISNSNLAMIECDDPEKQVSK